MLLSNDLRGNTHAIGNLEQCQAVDLQAQLNAKRMVQNQVVEIAWHAHLGLIEKAMDEEIIRRFSPQAWWEQWLAEKPCDELWKQQYAERLQAFQHSSFLIDDFDPFADDAPLSE